MTSVKYNTGMGLGALAGLLAAYILDRYWHAIYLNMAYIVIGPALMWAGLSIGKFVQKKFDK
jgi:VIT1/CCC1 family predicted Fe2+/Mn2+ transporter